NGVEPAVRAAQRALLDVRGPGGSQVVRGLEPTAPCEPVQLVEFAAAGARDVEIQRLCLVDPFLPTRGGGDQPRRVDLECGRVEILELGGDTVDVTEIAVEVFQVGHHRLVPQTALPKVVDQRRVDRGEVAGHVRL